MFEAISLVSVPTPFITPLRRSKLIDYEWGGIAIQNPSKGLMYTLWEAHTLGYNVRLYNTTEHVTVDVFSGTYAPKQIGFAFDVNMNYAVAYLTEDNVLHWKWFDTDISDYTTTIYEGVSSVACTLDDPRDNLGIWNDIVLLYVRNDSLYYRLQRDRYTVEYPITDLERRDIMQLGMSLGHRLQLRHCFKRGE